MFSYLVFLFWNCHIKWNFALCSLLKLASFIQQTTVLEIQWHNSMNQQAAPLLSKSGTSWHGVQHPAYLIHWLKEVARFQVWWLLPSNISYLPKGYFIVRFLKQKTKTPDMSVLLLVTALAPKHSFFLKPSVHFSWQIPRRRTVSHRVNTGNYIRNCSWALSSERVLLLLSHSRAINVLVALQSCRFGFIFLHTLIM